jgi:2'-5' RNA ligase
VTFEGDSALIVPIPAADPVIHKWRLLHDSASAAGVPAHVTVLYPFVPRAEIDGEVEATVRRALAPFPAFACQLSEVRWFGDEVAYLAPEPDSTFRRLLAAMWAAFPDHPPYEGAHEDPTPHVTIGHQGPGLDEAVRAVQEHLPIESLADRVELITLTEGWWSTTATFPLPGASVG